MKHDAITPGWQSKEVRKQASANTVFVAVMFFLIVVSVTAYAGFVLVSKALPQAALDAVQYEVME